MRISIKRQRTSQAWDYAASLDQDGNLPLNSQNKPMFRCQKCVDRGRTHNPRGFLESGGTGRFLEHLQRDHGVDLLSTSDVKRSKDAAFVGSCSTQTFPGLDEFELPLHAVIGNLLGHK